jgi:hypothetical protein
VTTNREDSAMTSQDPKPTEVQADEEVLAPATPGAEALPTEDTDESD